jgi:hypothetical protein
MKIVNIMHDLFYPVFIAWKVQGDSRYPDRPVNKLFHYDKYIKSALTFLNTSLKGM